MSPNHCGLEPDRTPARPARHRRPPPPLAPAHLRAHAPARGSGRRARLAATVTEARRHSQIAQEEIMPCLAQRSGPSAAAPCRDASCWHARSPSARRPRARMSRRGCGSMPFPRPRRFRCMPASPRGFSSARVQDRAAAHREFAQPARRPRRRDVRCGAFRRRQRAGDGRDRQA